MKKHIYSELAIENYEFEVSDKKDILSSKSGWKEIEKNGIKISRITVGDDDELRYKCRKGTHITLSYEKVMIGNPELSDSIADQLRDCLDSRLKKHMDNETRILVVGLGNIEMTADSLGPCSVKKITVTGDIDNAAGMLFGTVKKCKVFAVCAGVMGDTGMESAQIVKAVSRECCADAIIAVDSLAARDPERLICTVQISDNGISPGSGIYNKRREISERTMEIPVIAIGIPTVIDSATLVSKVLLDAGIEKSNTDIDKVLEEQRGFFVAPKDVDVTVRALSSLLAESIDKALTVKEYNSDSVNII